MNVDLRPDPLDDRLDRALCSLDVGGIVTDTDQIRAEASLERILATSEPDGFATAVSPRRRWVRRAAWLVPATAAAAVVGAVTIPAMTRTESTAYASWTRTPSAVAPKDLEDARRACQRSLVEQEERGATMDPAIRPDVRAQTAKVVAAEGRGEYVLVALATESGATLSCLSAADDPGRTMAAGGSSPSADTAQPAPLKAGEVAANGAGYASGPEGSVADLLGRVGPGVKAVTIRAADRTVDASVRDGWFAAWWPAPTRTDEALRNALPGDDSYRIDLTMADGSVRTDVPVIGRPEPLAKPGPKQIGRIVRGGGSDQHGRFGTVRGAVGSDVVGVRVHAEGRDLDATMDGATFSVRWSDPVDGITPDPTYDLTLRDGTVLTNVKPVS